MEVGPGACRRAYHLSVGAPTLPPPGGWTYSFSLSLLPGQQHKNVYSTQSGVKTVYQGPPQLFEKPTSGSQDEEEEEKCRELRSAVFAGCHVLREIPLIKVRIHLYTVQHVEAISARNLDIIQMHRPMYLPVNLLRNVQYWNHAERIYSCAELIKNILPNYNLKFLCLKLVPLTFSEKSLFSNFK